MSSAPGSNLAVSIPSFSFRIVIFPTIFFVVWEAGSLMLVVPPFSDLILIVAIVRVVDGI